MKVISMDVVNQIMGIVESADELNRTDLVGMEVDDLIELTLERDEALSEIYLLLDDATKMTLHKPENNND